MSGLTIKEVAAATIFLAAVSCGGLRGIYFQKKTAFNRDSKK
jgi:hypothetical protein